MIWLRSELVVLMTAVEVSTEFLEFLREVSKEQVLLPGQEAKNDAFLKRVALAFVANDVCHPVACSAGLALLSVSRPCRLSLGPI